MVRRASTPTCSSLTSHILTRRPAPPQPPDIEHSREAGALEVLGLDTVAGGSNEKGVS
jgi:hypothetical protein